MRVYIDLDIEKLKDLVTNQIIDDYKGSCVFIYDGNIMNNYIINLNNKVVATSGRILDYTYFKTRYDLDKIIIRYYPNKFGYRLIKEMRPELVKEFVKENDNFNLIG